MNRAVTAGAPTRALPQQRGVRDFADVNLARWKVGGWRLRVAAQTEIRIVRNEHLAVYRTVRRMANPAAFAQRFMLEDEWSRLLAMTFRARLIMPHHRKAAGGFENIAAMWIMTVTAIHPAFEHWMMLRQLELGVR
jgi:hypothetical protein